MPDSPTGLPHGQAVAEDRRRETAPVSESRAARQEIAELRRRDALREKVVQWCKDFWRPYHGSTQHHEDRDGLMMVENRDLSGGSWPLNAAVMKTWGDDKLAESRRLFGRELYALAMDPKNARIFGEMHDLFGRYGAGDSDYDHLWEKARGEDGDVCHLASKARLDAVDTGIDMITDALIEKGIGDRDFWAEFGLDAVPTTKTVTKEERYRTYYLYFLERCDEYRQRFKRYRNKALQATAEHFAVSKRTVEEAVFQIESGYVALEAS